MIIAFSPEQAHEVSQAFNAHWLMNEALYADWIQEEEDSNKKANNDSKKSQEKSSPSPTTTAAADSKPPAKTSMNWKKACRPNNNCNNRANTTFRPCFRYNNLAARCNRQQQASRQQQKSVSSTTKRTIDQRTPIHLHEETPDAARMSLDITGFTQQDVTITVEDHVVFVKGERTNRLGDVFVLDRKFRLDKKTALVEEVTATFDNDGILEITVPKKSLVGPRTIPIVVTTTSRTSDESASELENQEEKSQKDTSVSVSTKEDSVVTEPTTQEVEDPQSPEGTNHSSRRRESLIELVAVKAVQEIETNHDEEEDDDDESQSIASATYTTSNKSTEDEAWEEVSK
jgi:HSP20 family molecular chaperone IbpA